MFVVFASRIYGNSLYIYSLVPCLCCLSLPHLWGHVYVSYETRIYEVKATMYIQQSRVYVVFASRIYGNSL